MSSHSFKTPETLLTYEAYVEYIGAYAAYVKLKYAAYVKPAHVKNAEDSL
jgi:hypothetical protein